MEKSRFLPSPQRQKGGGERESEKERDYKGGEKWRPGGRRQFAFSNLI